MISIKPLTQPHIWNFSTNFKWWYSQRLYWNQSILRRLLYVLRDWRFIVQSYMHSNKLVSGVCLWINPCWCRVINLHSSKKSISLLFIILSITWQHIEVKDIGLKLFESLVPSFLWIGIAWASNLIKVFNFSGRRRLVEGTSWWKDWIVPVKFCKST